MNEKQMVLVAYLVTPDTALKVNAEVPEGTLCVYQTISTDSLKQPNVAENLGTGIGVALRNYFNKGVIQ